MKHEVRIEKLEIGLEHNRSRKPLARLRHALFHLLNPQQSESNRNWNAKHRLHKWALVLLWLCGLFLAAPASGGWFTNGYCLAHTNLGVMISCTNSYVLNSRTWPLRKDDHTVDIIFAGDLTTNRVLTISHGRWFAMEQETPSFPNTNYAEIYYAVMSNAYALFVLDGKTNRVEMGSSKIGRIIAEETTIVFAVTNSVRRETYEPTKPE